MAIENFTPVCKVNYVMVGQDGNAFALMGGFAQQARRDGWDKADIDKVINEAMTGDYDHLLATLGSYCVNGGFGLDDEEDEEDY